MYSRRDILKYGVGAVSGAPMRIFTGGSGLVLAALPRPVRAEPATLAIMAAAAIANRVAGANRTDGGLASLSQANHDLLKVALNELRLIQDTLVQILVELAKLPSVFQKLLHEQDIRRLHTELSGVVVGYIALLANKDPGQKNEEWRKDQNTQKTIDGLIERLRKASQELKAIGEFGPLTAVVVSPIGLVEHSLMNLRRENPEKIIRTIKNDHIDWLNLMVDHSRSTSAASYAANAAKELQRLILEVRRHPLGGGFDLPYMESGQPPNGNPKRVGKEFAKGERRSVHMACAGVNDAGTPDRPCPPPRDDGPRRGGLLSPRGSLVHFACGGPGRPPGIRDRVMQTASMTEEEFILNGAQTGIRLLHLKQDEAVRFRGGDAGRPHDGACEVVTEDTNGDNSKSWDRMLNLTAWRVKDQHYNSLDPLIDQINLQRANFAFGINAVSACETAKESLSRILALYR